MSYDRIKVVKGFFAGQRMKGIHGAIGTGDIDTDVGIALGLASKGWANKGEGGVPVALPYVTFTSISGSITLRAGDGKHWDGIIEYSYDGATWNEWDGTTITGETIILRGKGNSYLAGSTQMSSNQYSWNFGGSATSVRCSGNMETLLDYRKVRQNIHPTMAKYCFQWLFANSPIITPPELPAETLSIGCYAHMFSGSDIYTPPALPAHSIPFEAYFAMFMRCNSLSSLPKLEATSYGVDSCCLMFSDCTGILLSETQSAWYRNEYRIPAAGTGSFSSGALDDMFLSTGGSFTGTPAGNTAYYTSNNVI